MIKFSKFRSFWAILPYLYTYLKKADQKYNNPNYRGSDKKIAIYCIHGTADRYNAFAKAARYMHKKLPKFYSCIRLVKFDGNFTKLKIQDFADQLIKQVLANEDKEVVFIGHSSGGLISTYASEYLSKKFNINVRTVMSIATPYRGSWWASLPFLRQFSSIQQMQVDQPFLIELSKHIFSHNTQYVFISAKRDKIVRDKAFLPYGFSGEKNSYHFPYDGHISIMHNTELYDLMLNHLR